MDFETIRQIDIHPFHTSSTEERYLLCYEGRNFESNKMLVELIRVINRSSTPKEVAESFSDMKGSEYTEEDIEAIVTKYLNPVIGVRTGKQKSGTFLFKKELIPSSIVDLFSQVLKLLFRPMAIGLLLSVILCFEIIFFSGTHARFSLGEVSIYTTIGILVLYICSSLFHELGHASACKHFEIDHGGIGFGIYMNFPVFYTDVSNTWKLPRKQRIVVNFSGIYFQLIYLIPLFIIYFLTYDNIVKYFLFTINLNFLITLNPFLKFDGYWVTSDLLGVPNLRERTRELLTYAKKKLLRKPVDNKPFLLTMRPLEKVFMVVYSSVVNFFFLYYFLYLMPKFLGAFFTDVPGKAEVILESLSLGEMPSFADVIAVFSGTLFFCFTVFFIVKMGIKYYRKLFPAPKKN